MRARSCLLSLPRAPFPEAEAVAHAGFFMPRGTVIALQCEGRSAAWWYPPEAPGNLHPAWPRPVEVSLL